MAESSLPPLRRAEEIMGTAIAEGTRAAILTRPEKAGRRTNLEVGFADLGWKKSSIVRISPVGLRRLRFETLFGNFAGSTIRRMNSADKESKMLASALIDVIEDILPTSDSRHNFLNVPIDKYLSITGMIGASSNDPEGRLLEISKDVIAPLMSAFAELNGYDVIVDNVDNVDHENNHEGQITFATVKRRERNPRNKMLALRIHGSACLACGVDVAKKYGLEKSVVDIHHLQPLGSNDGPTLYDPATDLIPLCPTCHRIAHIRHPVPYDLEELGTIVKEASTAEVSP